MAGGKWRASFWDISGAEPHAEPYLKYLEEKFGAIYGI